MSFMKLWYFFKQSHFMAVGFLGLLKRISGPAGFCESARLVKFQIKRVERYQNDWVTDVIKWYWAIRHFVTSVTE